MLREHPCLSRHIDPPRTYTRHWFSVLPQIWWSATVGWMKVSHITTNVLFQKIYIVVLKINEISSPSQKFIHPNRPDGVKVSMYTVCFLPEIEWNILIYTEKLCSPNPNPLGLISKTIILLGIEWHIQICIERSCLPIPTPHVGRAVC